MADLGEDIVGVLLPRCVISESDLSNKSKELIKKRKNLKDNIRARKG